LGFFCGETPGVSLTLVLERGGFSTNRCDPGERDPQAARPIPLIYRRFRVSYITQIQKSARLKVANTGRVSVAPVRDGSAAVMQILSIGLGLAASAFLGFELFRLAGGQMHLHAQLSQKNNPKKHRPDSYRR
jgi:hypothetical protein